MKYLVRLQPIGPFFFGGNRTFSFRGNLTLNDSYIIESTRLPQQTHLLGMIRRVMLEKESILCLGKSGWGINKDDENNAVKLVGVNNSSSSAKLGKIKSLSCVFLMTLQNDQPVDFHFVIPKDTGIKLDFDKYKNSKVCIGGIKNSASVFFEHYKAKDGVKQGFSTRSFWSKYCRQEHLIAEEDILSDDRIYKQVWQIGIKRKDRTVVEDEDGSLYKQCSYLLKRENNENFQFGFVLELTEDLFGAKFERQVYLGAQRSLFQMVIEPFKDEFNEFMPPSQKQFSKAVVIGELFDSQYTFNSDKFILNNGCTAFSRIVPNKGSKCNDYRTTKDKQSNLLPKGTVIFFLDKTNKKLAIEDNFYTKIGYNSLIYI